MNNNSITTIKKIIKPDYTVITVLMLFVYWFHYDFLVVDYYWCLLIGLACIICTAILWPIAFFLGLVLCACSYRTISLEAFTHPYNLNQVPTYKSPNKFYSYLQADTEGGWIVEIQKQRPIHAL